MYAVAPLGQQCTLVLKHKRLSQFKGLKGGREVVGVGEVNMDRREVLKGWFEGIR